MIDFAPARTPGRSSPDRAARRGARPGARGSAPRDPARPDTRPSAAGSTAGASSPAEVRARRARLGRLGDEIARLSAHLQAATGRQLDLIRDFDEERGWHEEGFASCARWLAWRTGITPGAAREKVRVARALGRLPALSGALRVGELSYSVARALTRVATPDNEVELLEVARHGTAAQMERLVAAWRAADAADAAEEAERERHARRELWVLPAADGSWTLHGRLDPEAGAVLPRALEAAGEALYGRAPTGPEPGGEARPPGRAGPAPEPPHLEPGPRISAETARRLACDAGVVTMIHDRGGSPLDVGRRTRAVPPALRRALDHRDRRCRFPGCEARFCDAHHMRHWADGGPTRLDNLVLLCRRHHRRVHEDGWRVVRSPDGQAGDAHTGGELRFYRPDGRLLPRRPPAPAVPDRPVTALERRHRALGLEIDARTPTPAWDGTPMDVDWALFTLRRPARPGAERDVSAETADAVA